MNPIIGKIKKVVSNLYLMGAILVCGAVVFVYFIAQGVAEEWEKPSVVRTDIHQFDN